jgi:non-ribosomal peptide synthetase component F
MTAVLPRIPVAGSVRDVAASAPLSFAQRRVFVRAQLDPEDPEQNLPYAVRVHGRLDRVALQEALTELIFRHETLRTRFITVDGEPRQLAEPPTAVRLRVADVSDLPPGAAEVEAARVVGQAIAAPFDLSRGPLLRGDLVVLGPDEHLLLLTAHRLACDDRSLGIVIEELAEVYGRLAAGRAGGPVRPDRWVPPPLRYADYARAQVAQFSGGAPAESERYWREQLAGLPPAGLPTDRPRPARASGMSAGAGWRLQVPAPVLAAVRTLAEEEDTAPFTVLLAAFHLLLHRHTGQGRVAAGTTAANRRRPERARVIGPFANTLVIAAQVAGVPSFRALVRRVGAAARCALAHQDFPLELARGGFGAVQPPVCDVLFEMPEGTVPLVLAGLRTTEYPLSPASARADLALSLAIRDGVLVGDLSYRTDLFDLATVDRLAAHFERLLADAVAAPDGRLSELDMLTPAERTQLLADWGTGGCTRPAPRRCVHELLAEQVLRTPRRLAAAERGTGRSLTFAELDARANRLAWHLRERGVRAEATVGVRLHRGLDLLVAVLAVWRAGGACLPLPPGLPAASVAFRLADSGAAVVVGRSGDGPGGTCVRLEEEARAIAGQPTRPPPTEVRPDNLAYVAYPPGLGHGVRVPHAALATFLSWCTEGYVGERGGGAPAFSADGPHAWLPHLFVPLLAGQPAYLLPEDLPADRLCAALLAGAPYAFVRLTPGQLDALADQLTPRQAGGLCGLVLLCGGEFPVRTLRRWRAIDPDTPVLTEYIPARAPLAAAVHRAGGGTADGGELLPIGAPIPGTSLYVLDAALNPAPPGVPGDIYVGGCAVARGFTGPAAATAAWFVPDPFADTPGARMVRTGDRGRWRPSGEVELVGRVSPPGPAG